MNEINILDSQASEAAIAWALDQARRGDRESMRWLQDRRAEGNQAAAHALVEMALSELGVAKAVLA